MSSVAERLVAIREKLETGRSDNLEAVERECRKVSEGKRYAEEDLSGCYSGNDDPSSNYAVAQKKRKHKRMNDLGSADEADEEDQDARLRSMKRRARVATKWLERKGTNEREGPSACSEASKCADMLEYGGKGVVSEEAVDRMVNELQQADKRRGKFKRRRAFYEDEGDITFINEGNRLFNRTLSKHYDKFDSVKEIKDNLERGTA